MLTVYKTKYGRFRYIGGADTAGIAIECLYLVDILPGKDIPIFSSIFSVELSG